MFENKALKRIFEHERKEGTGERKLQNEKPNNLYSSPTIFTVIKSRMMRRVGNVACWV